MKNSAKKSLLGKRQFSQTNDELSKKEERPGVDDHVPGSSNYKVAHDEK